MKAITLTQPYATLAAINAKRIETRGWKTDYRGPLAIHAAKGWTEEVVKMTMRGEPFRSVLVAAGYSLFSLLPRGAVLATCTLVDCRRIVAGVKEFGANGVLWPLDDQERAFGDYTPGRYAWLLADMQPLPTPMPARGSLGLWKWSGEAAQ
ncbi:MAG: 2-oxoglutarate dehydrogenase E1 [Anaerolineales bacterium]|nr:2-oxoglutarate dehydrogenase E1 [Anaerolineales bacterium]